MIINSKINVVNINLKNDKNNNPIKKSKKSKKYGINSMKTNYENESSSIRKISNKNSILLDYKKEKNKNYKKYKEKYNDYELNELHYEEAIKIDKRTFIQYYLSLLRLNQLFIFAFCTKNDHNSRIIKICIFLFSLSLYFTINALFFDESVIHNIYDNQGNFIFIYQIPQIVYSSIISSFLMTLIRFFSLSQKEILKIKHEECLQNINNRIENAIKCLKIKFTLFFIIELAFLFFFWYYLASFCAIYKNTQIFLIKDALISFGFSLLYPLFYSLLPGVFGIPSLRDSKKGKECMYKLSKLLQIM